jgi:hypothetical protein
MTITIDQFRGFFLLQYVGIKGHVYLKANLFKPQAFNLTKIESLHFSGYSSFILL